MADIKDDLIGETVELSAAACAIMHSVVGQTIKTLTELKREDMNCKLLLYGADGWISQRFLHVLAQHDIRVTLSTLNPGDCSDKAVEDEIVSINPTHVISFMEATDPTVTTTSATNVDDHTRQSREVQLRTILNIKLKQVTERHIYGPWLLAELCRKLGPRHFTRVANADYFSGWVRENSSPNRFNNDSSISSAITDRMLRHYHNVLSVRIRCPIASDRHPNNYLQHLLRKNRVSSTNQSFTVLDDMLPVLLNLALCFRTGSVNLVNPSPISFDRVMQLYKQLVDDQADWVKEPKGETGCVMDTKTLETLVPQVLTSEQAIVNCFTKFKKQADALELTDGE